MKRYRIPRFVALCAVAAVLSGTALAAEDAQVKPATDKPAAEGAQPAPAEAAKPAEAKDAQAKEPPAAGDQAKDAQVKDAQVKEASPKETKEAPVKESAVASSALVKAQGKLAISMLKQLSGGKKGTGGSVIVSPSSLAGALSVVELGAGEELRSSIPRVLGFDDSPMAWAELKTLRSITSHAAEGAPYTTANAIVIDEAAKPSASVVDVLTGEGVETKVRPFSKPETLQELNDWVVKQTHNLIPKIIDKLPDEGGIVTLNALYFKDRWKKTFNPADTKTTPFRMVGGKTVDARMMQSDNGKFKFYRDKKFDAVDLPYATEGYSIAIVTTKGEPGSMEEFTGAAELLTGKGYADGPGDVRIPRLDLSGNNNLKGTILDLMKGKNGNGSVTVSRFTSKPVQLASALQRVVLKLDEEGTEAAAATALSMKRDMDDKYFRFFADRPFVFALRDAKTGLILVAGYVAQPS